MSETKNHSAGQMSEAEFNSYYNINSKVKQKPELREQGIILSVRHLKQFFFFGKGPKRQKLKAVSNVSFDIKEGECLGIVGESGCGKTTTGRSIIRLYDITSGSVYYKGVRVSGGTRWNNKEIKWSKIRGDEEIQQIRQKLEKDIAGLDKGMSNYQERVSKLNSDAQKAIAEINARVANIKKEQQEKIRQINFDNAHTSRKLLNEIQMIFQDPIDSLDPRMTVEDIIQEGLRIQGFRNKKENHEKVVEMLNRVFRGRGSALPGHSS